jgi:hypothetical protein
MDLLYIPVLLPVRGTVFCKLAFSGMSVGIDQFVGYFCVVYRYNWKKGLGSPVDSFAIS